MLDLVPCRLCLDDCVTLLCGRDDAGDERNYVKCCNCGCLGKPDPDAKRALDNWALLPLVLPHEHAQREPWPVHQ